MTAHVALVVGGLAVAGACAAVAAGGQVGPTERAAFHALNDLPGALTPALWVAQLSGVIVVPLLLAVAALCLRRGWLALALALVAPLKLLIEHAVVKELVQRQRPGTSICNGDSTCATFRDVPLEGLSFVSGHAIITWAVAVLLWTHLAGRWRWLPVSVAVLNGIARIHLGAHAPLDILGGAGIGVALGAALAIAVARGDARRLLGARSSPVPRRDDGEQRDVVAGDTVVVSPHRRQHRVDELGR